MELMNSSDNEINNKQVIIKNVGGTNIDLLESVCARVAS